MRVHVFYCPGCDERWDAVGVDNPRETCIDCGAKLDVRVQEVA